MKPKRRDFRLNIIVLQGFTAAATIASFGVYRMWGGEWTKAWFDLAVVAAVAAPVIHAWRGGDSLRAGNVLAALNSAATFGACLLLGHTALTWTCLVLLTNFFIAHRWMAVACNALLIVGMQLIPGFFHDGVHAASVLVSASLITVFSLIFAARTQDDRVQLERLAAIDALTGVPNRRSMERALADAVGRFQRGERRFGLVVLDLDHFKDVNDQYGHPAGDRVLCSVVNVLRQRVRAQDLVGRYGGEEFMVLLPDTGLVGAEQLAHELCKAVEESRCPADGVPGPGIAVAVSIGVFGGRLESGDSWDMLIAAADRALYQAKNNGRNRVEVATGLRRPSAQLAAQANPETLPQSLY